MCFSNLPIEFDEAGNPYLAEDADAVERVDDCGCGTDVGIEEDDPEAVVDAVLSSVPEDVREEIGDRDGDRRDGDRRQSVADDGRADDPARGD